MKNKNCENLPLNIKVAIKCKDNKIRKFKIVDYSQFSKTIVIYYLKSLGRYKDINGLIELSVKDIYYMLKNNSLTFI